MGVADAVLSLDCRDELVDERVELARVGPGLPLQVLQQLLVRRVELHPRRKPRQILYRRRSLQLTGRSYILSVVVTTQSVDTIESS